MHPEAERIIRSLALARYVVCDNAIYLLYKCDMLFSTMRYVASQRGTDKSVPYRLDYIKS